MEKNKKKLCRFSQRKIVGLGMRFLLTMLFATSAWAQACAPGACPPVELMYGETIAHNRDTANFLTFASDHRA